MRVANQTQASLQREYIQSALRSMAVWNVWDMDVVKNIIVNPSQMQYQTIDNMVRLRSGLASRSKKSMGETQSFAIKSFEEEGLSQNHREMYKSLNKVQSLEHIYSPQANPKYKNKTQSNQSFHKTIKSTQIYQPDEEISKSKKPSSPKENSNQIKGYKLREETLQQILSRQPRGGGVEKKKKKKKKKTLA
eukprot:TRINITY_DN8309_c0_g1_i3.p3 TRINITY_DN8309_c0_g1~~TRINITY_DN8309_c0_g1_i3.p3  ORF type:complete len:191 (-),score=31.97 TRINITY_DN8309_c0_g1_i3:158-730(-)